MAAASQTTLYLPTSSLCVYVSGGMQSTVWTTYFNIPIRFLSTVGEVPPALLRSQL